MELSKSARMHVYSYSRPHQFFFKTSQELRVPVILHSRVPINVVVLLNCHKCNQCLKGHKSLALLFYCALFRNLEMPLSMSILVRSCHLITLIIHTYVSNVTSLQDYSLRVFFKCLCHCSCLCHCLCLCLISCHCHCLRHFGHVMSPHHSDHTYVSNVTSLHDYPLRVFSKCLCHCSCLCLCLCH